MIDQTLLIIWGIWLLLILIAAFRVLGFLTARRRQEKRWGKGTRNQHPVALIVPVKGFELQATPRFFDSIFGQDYSDYRVIVCFESWDDPVAQWLSEHLEAGPGNPVWTHPREDNGLRSVTLVCAGVSEREGQKVHNQIAAFADLTSRDTVIAFADADIVCGPDWLARLVAPINQGTHPLSTTYRWLIPKRPTFPNQIASVINGSIATQGGGELTNVLWGGSMALSREVFLEVDVPQLFSGSLNDDLRLSKAARKAGHKIAFVRSLIIPTMIDFNWRSFFEFAKRQYTQVKFFSPILYTGVNIVLGFYVLGAATIVAAIVYGKFYAWIPVAAAYVIDQFRALARQQIYLSLFQENGIRQKLFAAGWLEHMLTPLWLLIHWLIVVSTWTQNKITWAGIRYRLRSPSKTQILFRPVVAERLPAGVPGLAMLGALRDERRRGHTMSIRPLQESMEEPVTFTSLEQDAAELVVSDTVSTSAGTEKTMATQLAATGKTDSIPVQTEAKGDLSDASSGKVETAQEEAKTTAPVPVKEVIPAPRLSHPGGPSAIIPITTAFYERRVRESFRLSARERGSLSAPEATLMKSRVTPAFLHPTVPPAPPKPKTESLPLPGNTAKVDATTNRPVSSGVISAPDRSKQKTRLGGATHSSPKEKVESALHGGLSRVERLSQKTRLKPSAVFLPPSRPEGSATSSKSAPSGKVSFPSPALQVFTLPLVSGKSPAARRPNTGGHNTTPHRGTAAISSRAFCSSRGGANPPEARPVNPRASSRP